MATQYTPILQLALPVTGELNGTWGDVVNDNITSMVEQAIAGLATINTWTTNSHTLTTADGTTDEARCAMLVAQTGAGGTALTGAGEIICPARTKLFVLQNGSAYAVTLKTSAGTGIAVAAGDTAFLFCDGTNVNACVTQIVNGHITGNLTVDGNTTLGNTTSDTITATARIASDLNPSADNTYDLGTSGNSWRNLYIDGTATIASLNVTTIDTTNLEVTNIKAKDGTAAITIADTTGAVTVSSAFAANGNSTLGDASTDTLTINATATANAPVVISTNSASDALRITQVGTGNALVVEDSANPDATPFVIDTNGYVVQGKTTARTNYFAGTTISSFQGSDFLSVDRGGAFSAGPAFILAKNRGTTGGNTIIVQNDSYGQLSFQGADGTNMIAGASIEAFVDGTPGTNDMPGRLVFSTTADGASSPTERMRIGSNGTFGYGIANSPSVFQYNYALGLTGSIIYGTSTILQAQSGTTGGMYGFNSNLGTAAASFTLGGVRHFNAGQGTFGAGSTVSAQYGFLADSNLTGATNNYGFFSNIASGTGRYNFYAAGSADNYFAGRLGLGSASLTSINFRNSLNMSGSVSSGGMVVDSIIQSDVTSDGNYYTAYAQTVAAAFTLTNMRQFYARQGALGAGSAVTNQFGFATENNLTGATNNFGFYSAIASGTGRYNFYAGGSAANYMAGPLSAQNFASIGVASDLVSSAANLYTLSGTGGTLSSLLWRFVTGANDVSAGTERMRITASGSVLIGTATSGASKLVVNDDSIQINTAKTPASATATGTTGQVSWDANYMYVCVATNTWKRTAIATW